MTQNSQSIQQLLAEARAGSRKGMGHLAVIIWDRLYPFIFRATYKHDVTEDILQETLLTVVRELASLREDRRFWAWVHRIAWNKMQDNVRRHRLHAAGKAALVRSQSSNAGSGDLLEATIHEERLQQLSALMDQLSQGHRDVLRLRFYEQLPYTEIASVTRTTPQMARARFHRARKHLRAQLQCAAK